MVNNVEIFLLDHLFTDLLLQVNDGTDEVLIFL